MKVAPAGVAVQSAEKARQAPAVMGSFWERGPSPVTFLMLPRISEEGKGAGEAQSLRRWGWGTSRQRLAKGRGGGPGSDSCSGNEEREVRAEAGGTRK